MNHMNISIVKSIIRITASILAILSEFEIVHCALNNVSLNSLVVLAGGYGIAEILGILEEVFDKRKEV